MNSSIQSNGSGISSHLVGSIDLVLVISFVFILKPFDGTAVLPIKILLLRNESINECGFKKNLLE